jgi:hypothetical protein
VADETPKEHFTAEQTEALQAMMGKTVNSILTARLATSEKTLLSKLTPTIGDALKAQLPDLIKGLIPAPPDPDEKDGKGGKGTKRAEDAVEMATLRKQVEDLRKANELSDRKAQASEQKQREMERQRYVVDALAKGGVVDPFKQELALAYLDKKKRIEWTGDGDEKSLVWNDDIGTQVSPEEGLASWMKSEEAKHFLPPAGTKGSGGRPGNGGGPNTGGKPTKEQAWGIVGEALKEGLGSL